ncbi:hypothetical protein Tco_1319207 [Tanacetum coccineum]
MEEVVSTWLIRSYRKQFEEYIEIKRRLEVYGLYTDVECDPSNVDFVEWLAFKFSNRMTMDWYTKNALWLYWIRGDDEEVLTDEELSYLKDEKISEEKEIAEIFRIETNIFDFETPLCKEFKEFNHLLQINDCDLKDEALKEKDILEGSWRHENKEGKNFFSWLKECFGNYQEHDYELIRKLEEHWWGKKEEEELMEDDDDIMDLDDYLIRQDASYYVDEDEERFKEMKSKLLGMPYEKPPTFKSEKFEAIKYSLGHEEEYVAIKEYEYDI